MIGISLSALLFILALSVPVAAALGVLTLLLIQFGTQVPLERMIGDMAWTSMASDKLVAIPFFILMGELVLRSGLAEKMYAALVEWLSWLPGGTMHANIGSCALFAATSGSSVATAATIGTVAMPQIEKNGYDEPLFLGSIAAGGTLGILIPPSVGLIVYGVLAEVSIPRLYLAGMIPGFLLAALFSLFIAVVCLWQREKGGRPVRTTWAARIALLPALLPPLFIFTVVVLTIYMGIATPTEAAAFGVVAALGLAAMTGRLNLAMLRAASEGTIRTSAMVVGIILAALVLNFVLAFLGISRQITDTIFALDLGPTGIMLAIVVLYLILGCFLEGFSIVIITVPIIVPLVIELGYDPIWFGIVLTLLLEAALITPPIGVNLYVVQSVRERGGILDVIRGSWPFVLVMLAMVAALFAAPGLALWLPEFVYGS
ncbi:MAG: TRAP transporter large permease [Pseudomonadota bacterium]